MSMHRQFSRLIATFTLLLSVWSSQTLGQERWQQEGYLIDSFMAIAMASEYNEVKNPRFARWKQPIVLKLINETGDKALQQQVVTLQSQHLSQITGHPIRILNDNTNLTVVMTSHKRMPYWAERTIGKGKAVQQALNEGLCLANYTTNSQHEIIEATVLIPVDYSRAKGRFLDCVVEELTQVMGLPNDSDKVFPSIFNDNSVDRFLTGLDYLLLKIAYDPALIAGMDRQQVRRRLPAIIAKLRQRQEIANATQRVQSNSLKKWAQM